MCKVTRSLFLFEKQAEFEKFESTSASVQAAALQNQIDSLEEDLKDTFQMHREKEMEKEELEHHRAEALTLSAQCLEWNAEKVRGGKF